MQYQETENGSYTCKELGLAIPKAEGNRHYRAMMSQVEAGEATLVPFDHNAKAQSDYLVAERAWRDSELASVDINYRLVQGGRGKGTLQDWDDYANLLRDWPAHDRFPEPHHRPLFIDSTEVSND